jgi:hypothetical protein
LAKEAANADRVKILLILKRVGKRPSGTWSSDDFYMLVDGIVVGRIFNAKAATVGNRGCGVSKDRTPDTWL